MRSSGTGNTELARRQLVDRRIHPAIDVQRSGTRREDLLFSQLITKDYLMRPHRCAQQNERTQLHGSTKKKVEQEFLQD